MTIDRLFRSIQTSLFDAQPTRLTNSFFSGSQLKSRIKMLVDPRTNRRALWGYALVLPVSAVLLMCSQKDPVQTSVPDGTRKAVPTAAPVTGEVFTVVEQNPEFTGGMPALGDYISQHLRYPEAAQQANVTGKVFVQFVVTTEGKIRNVQVLKGVGFGCDAEAVRVVSQMPAWQPGLQSGKPVNVLFNLPINFTLE